ncbi:hypothetical protein NEOLI_002900 [Neolecta irregularis DAH-3]|uniref:Uncharacterized protein n=1 Tax=Neolecta irregularis (strain DAH-3) TaxID=1198029 RepID=A0A1U7LT11_NEOID|nr:hypothetical protein NEOLI_002900 [Neolecta irregularis DAH-3]|eukprot:OLL25723.1 hypothetical protein NEOLI_002900 [Neolecta irregularis DAH-3]
MPIIGRRLHTNSNSTHGSNNSNAIEEPPDSPRSLSSSDSSMSDRFEQGSSSAGLYHSADTRAGSIAPLQPIQPVISSTSVIAGTFFRRRASSASSAPQVSSQLSGKPQERSPGKHKLFSRPAKIATGLASTLTGTSPTNGRPLISPSPSFHRENERSNSLDLGQNRADASPPTQASHRHHLLLRPRKDSDPTSTHSKNALGPSSPGFASLKNLSGLDKGGKDSDKTSDFGHEDAWPLLCIRVIPLFSGEGLRLSVEDCNKLVTQGSPKVPFDLQSTYPEVL